MGSNPTMPTKISCIDVLEDYNLFIVIDQKTASLLEKVLKVKFAKGQAIKKGVMMRKQIAPMLDKF